jgi:hypothetical protein
MLSISVRFHSAPSRTQVFVLYGVGFIASQFAEAFLHSTSLLKDCGPDLRGSAGNQSNYRVGQMNVLFHLIEAGP